MREGADDETLADNHTPGGRDGAAEYEPADQSGGEGAADDELGDRQPNAGRREGADDGPAMKQELSDDLLFNCKNLKCFLCRVPLLLSNCLVT